MVLLNNIDVLFLWKQLLGELLPPLYYQTYLRYFLLLINCCINYPEMSINSHYFFKPCAEFYLKSSIAVISVKYFQELTK